MGTVFEAFSTLNKIDLRVLILILEDACQESINNLDSNGSVKTVIRKNMFFSFYYYIFYLTRAEFVNALNNEIQNVK